MKFKKISGILFFITIILLPSFFVLASQERNSASETHLIRIYRGNLSSPEQLNIRPLWTMEYGDDIWGEITNEDFVKLNESDIRYFDYPYQLNLSEEMFDPLHTQLSLPEGWTAVPGTDKDLFLLQFFSPTKDEWLSELKNEGIEIVQYIHPFTYVVWGDAGSMENISSLDFIRWSGDFHPAFRVLKKWQNLADLPFIMNALLYRGADIDTALSELQNLEAQLLGRKVLNATWETTQFILSGEKIREAAHVPGIYSIQLEKTDGGLRGEMSDQINVNNYDENNLAYPGYLDWLAAAALDGGNVIIANVDGGVQNNHPDLVNRLVPCNGDTCGGGASSNHGTHTAGIMAADGSSGVLDPYGFLRGLGMAPGANLVEQIYSPWYQQPGGMLLLMTDSFNNGATLSGNSWGPSGSPQGYDDDTLQVDIGVRDADPDVPGNQPLSYVLSIMNGNGGYQTQGTPDEAKNIFTIGSTKMQTSGGQQILDIDDLSSNTAHGPALDGRNIPHLVAPGCSVDSTITPSTYGTMCGTSMASPHVSGAVALFVEYYRNIFGVDPSPAMVKAAFLPVAHDLAGNLDADGGTLGHPFDYKQGWGRMDTAAVISPTVEIVYFDNPAIFDETGMVWEQPFAAVDPTIPVRMMLVWTDAPGHGLGGTTPAWNNDLDLVVEVNGDYFYGNNFETDGWSQSGGSPDYMNNTEGVFLGPIPPGNFSVQVVAANINSDGIPDFGDDTDQDFALVCYNCTTGADFTLSVVPVGQSICAPDPAVFDLTIGVTGPFNDEILLSTGGEPVGTVIDFSQNPVHPPATSVITVGNTVSATVGSYSIDVFGVGMTRTHTTTFELGVYDSQPGVVELLEPFDRSRGISLIPRFAWTDVDQAVNYQLELARDRDFTDLVVTASDLTTPTYTIEAELVENRLYFWRVSAQNVCGGNMSEVFSFSTITPIGSCPVGTTPVVGYSEGFENGGTGWIHGGEGDTWQLISSVDGFNFHADDVPGVSDQWLVSPVLELPGHHSSALASFWNYQSIQDLMNGCAAGAVFEVSENGGSSWKYIDSNMLLTDPYDGVINGVGNPLQGQAGWCGDPQDWMESFVNLDAYLGKLVSFRFRLGTDSDNIGHGGWDIDNVELLTCEPGTIIDKESNVDGLPGTAVVHTFDLENLGQSETYQLELTGYEWETSLLSGEVITLTEGASTTVQVEVQIPDLLIDSVHGSDTFTLTAIAENMPVLDIIAKGNTLAETNPAVELTPEMQTEVVQPGEMVEYVFTLTNQGNYADTYLLEVSGDWMVELPGGESSVVLVPGETIPVMVSVRTPESAVRSSSGMAVLSATSTLDPFVTASAYANTLIMETQFLPIIRR